MKSKGAVTTIFTDIGGVLLTNGWDHIGRERAVIKFNLNKEEVNERHHLTYDTFELGKIDLNTYLKRTVFYEKRNSFADGRRKSSACNSR